MDSTDRNIDATIRGHVDEVFVTRFEIPAEDLSPERHLFTDLGMDSLDAVDLAIAFQKKFQVKLDKEEVARIRTLGDVYQLAAKYAASPPDDAP